MNKEFMVSATCGIIARARGRVRKGAVCLLLAGVTLAAGACDTLSDPFGRRPQTMSEVPANRLAYRLEADFPAERIPPAVRADEAATETLLPIEKDFAERRKTDALLRTVTSPDGQRALALYAAGDTPEGEFRIDVYAVDGTFLTNVMPADISGAFPLTPAWSPDAQRVAFIARESPDAEARRKRGGATEARDPEVAPETTGTPQPILAPVASFQTEQIYVCDRDGRNLRPLTSRDGLIYFDFAFSPDARFLSALACTEDEWTANADEGLPPRGRARIIAIDGGERLLDDRVTSVVPAWSPDGSKVATAYETDVVIYDIAADKATVAAMPLSDDLLAASRLYDVANPPAGTQKNRTADAAPAEQQQQQQPTAATPLSYNPIIRLEWVEPDGILAQTAFLRIYRDTPPIKRYERWHVLHLSPQAQLLSRAAVRAERSALAACFNAHL